MNNIKDNVEWIVMAMQFKFGWLLGFSAWRTAASFSYGLFAKLGQSAMEAMIPDDREWAKALFNHRAYRIFRALFKALTSVQLPEVPRRPTGDTTTITRKP